MPDIVRRKGNLLYFWPYAEKRFYVIDFERVVVEEVVEIQGVEEELFGMAMEEIKTHMEQTDE